MKLALTTLTAGAVALSLASAASAATAQLSLTYLGSTTANLNAAGATNGGGFTANTNLSSVGSVSGTTTAGVLSTDPTHVTTAWKFYFQVGVTFSPDASGAATAEALRTLIFDAVVNNTTVTGVGLGGNTNANNVI